MKLEDAKVGMKVYDKMFPNQIGEVLYVGVGDPKDGYDERYYVRVKFGIDGDDVGSEHIFDYLISDFNRGYLCEVTE